MGFRKKGPLRTATDDWIKEKGEETGILKWFADMRKRREEVSDYFDAVMDDPSLDAKELIDAKAFTWIWYVLSGRGVSVRRLLGLLDEPPTVPFKEKIEDFWAEAFEDEDIQNVIDTIGTFTSEPILKLFEDFTQDDIDDPRAFVRRMHGLMISLTVAPGMLSTAMEALSLGKIKTPVEVIKGIYWNFGLGFLGWQSIAPMMNAGMLTVLERHYKGEWRPTRFGTSELRDLFALGEISDSELQEVAREQGWREEDIDLWIKLAYRTLREGDVHALRKAGEKDDGWWTKRMRALGYHPDDLADLHLLNVREDVTEAKAVSLSTAKRAFREGLLGEPGFREVMSDLGKSEQEIELLIALEISARETDIRSLTVSQIKSAWEENVLSDPEVRHWLSQNDFGGVEIGLLLRTWKAELEPEFRKVNKGTIVGAYINGVLNRSQGLSKLREIGFSAEDAGLELDLAEARNPELFGRPDPKPSRFITPGILGELLEADVITAVYMKERLVEQSYSDEDANLLLQAAILRAEGEPRPLTTFLLERAYAAGVLDRSRAFEKLIELEISEEDASIILNTVEEENPYVFAPETIQAVRLPSVGALTEAVRTGLINESEFYARMAEIGYDRASADMYYALGVRTERKRGKTLTASQVGNLYERRIFDRGTSMMRVMALGYTDDDASYFLRLYRSGIDEMDVWLAMLQSLVSPEDTVGQLFAMGFTEEEIVEAFEELEEESGEETE